MKNILLLILLAAGNSCGAQTPFLTVDSIDANSINASVLVHGDMWWNPKTGDARCFFPNGTRKTFNFAGSLWMSAYDNTGGLHVSAQTYRQDGNDYWPGPLDASGMLDYATSEKWAKIWKVRRSDIDAFNAITFHTIANTPEAILTWPGKGNAYAAGKDGAALSITEDMAPFVDRNGDGIYQPLKGDYPDIHESEQGLWWCFSDNGPGRSLLNNRPLGVQVHTMSYAYKRNTLIDQVVYYDYTVVNKSPMNYHDMRIAQWSDADLGYYMDDMIGFDSTWRMGIVYNGTEDDGGAAGHPLNSYGSDAPAMAITCVVLPGDGGGYHQPVGTFTYYNNDPSIIGNPVNDTQINYYLRSRIRNGAHLQYGGIDVNYMVPDDPTIPGGMHECGLNNNPGDRRHILVSNDFSFNAGGRTKIVLALLVDTITKACPSIMTNGYAPLRILADTAWGNYSVTVGVPATARAEGRLRVYPNPATDILQVELHSANATNSCIYSSLGQKVHEQQLRASVNSIDIRPLPPGMYTIVCNGNEEISRAVFIKQ